MIGHALVSMYISNVYTTAIYRDEMVQNYSEMKGMRTGAVLNQAMDTNSWRSN
jgi:hypothetical protein